MKNVFCALAKIGLLVAGSVSSAGAEPIYFYTGNSETGAATDEEMWKGANGQPVRGIIVRTEGETNEYRFQSGIYDGAGTREPVWLIGDEKDVYIVSDGSLAIQNWGKNSNAPNQGVITARGGKIIFGNDVSILNNYSSGYDTSGGGAIYSDKGIVFGDNARLVNNESAPPISGPYNGGGAIFLGGNGEGELIFGKSALIETNRANYGGAIDAKGSVSFGEGAIIRGNHAQTYGGAFRIQNGSLTLKHGSLVESNSADNTRNWVTAGGAFFIHDSKADIVGTTFKNNKTDSSGSGGAIHLEHSSSLNLSDGSLMEGNEASLGGAIYAISSSGVDINQSTFKNNKAATGGALFISDASLMMVQGGGSGKTDTKSVFEGNTASSNGGAIYVQSTDVTLKNGVLLENNQAAKSGGALYVMGNGSTKVSISDAMFRNNVASTTYGGAFYVQKSNVSINRTVMEGNKAAYGGAITALQSTVNLSDAVFRNNTSSQAGGAIFLQGKSLYYKVTETSDTPAISGNSSASGGFLYLAGAATATFDVDQGKLLQIGTPDYSGSDTNMDSLYIGETSSFKKTGSGKLEINSSMQNWWGKVSVEDGIMDVASYWAIRNSVTVTGGTLDASSFAFGKNGKLEINGGALLTNTKQVFDYSPDSDTSENPGAVDSHINFASGLISFNDSKYNLAYAISAATLLGASPTSKKEIIFTGSLYDKPGMPSTSVSVDDLKNINNLVLGGATITTETSTSSGQHLIVGADIADHVDGFDSNKTQTLQSSIGASNLNLGTDGSMIAVVGDKYLTLLGGETNTSLIQAGSDGNRAVDVFVGNTVNGTTSGGTLNLGTAGLASSGTLTGNVQIAESSVVNVRAGEHSISGESDSAAGQPVAGINNNGGTLNIAEQATLQTTVRQTTGNTNVSGTLVSQSVELEGGNLNLSGTAQIEKMTQNQGDSVISGLAKIEQLTQQGGSTSISGTVEAGSLEAAGGKLSVTGTLKADNLVVSNGMNIAVGNGNVAGKLSSSSVTLNGGGIFLDPDWRGNDTVETASHGALVFTNQSVDGQLAVGRNSLLVLGDTSVDRSVRMFTASGLNWGKDDISAALSINAPQLLDPTGTIIVDGSMATAPTPSPSSVNSATFGSGSLFMVDAAGLNGGAALTSSNGTLNVDQNASLLVGNATSGDYVITTGFTDNTNVRGWDGDRLASVDQLIGLTLDKSEEGSVKVHATALDVASTLPGIVMPGIITEIWLGGRNNTDSANAGIAFLSKTMDNRYLAANDTVRTINGASQIAIAAGVQASAIQASDSVNRTLQEHLSLSSNVDKNGVPSLHREGPDLWVSMLYRNNDTSGIRAGRFNADFKNDFGGILAGSDYTWKDTGNGSFRLGGALNIGKGEGKSRGDFNDTRNDYNTYGLSVYGSWMQANTNVMFDIGYMKGKNELKQTLPSTLGDSLKADMDTQVWTIGAQGEYKFKTASFDLTPHVGVRWLRLKTDAFRTHNSQGTVFRTDSDTQDIWQLPVGLSISRDYVAKNGWTVKPKLDISFIPATGDRNATTRIHVPGVAANDATRTEMMDSTSWNGSLGLDMQKDRLRVGVRAAYQKSSDERSRGFMLTVNRQFD